MSLENGKYASQPVSQVEITKGNGGTRLFGIPTVIDRFLQQALHQVLNPIFDPTLPANSFGFRVGKSAHQAVLQIQSLRHAGKRWVVDLNLKQFFNEATMMFLYRWSSFTHIFYML